MAYKTQKNKTEGQQEPALKHFRIPKDQKKPTTKKGE